MLGLGNKGNRRNAVELSMAYFGFFLLWGSGSESKLLEGRLNSELAYADDICLPVYLPNILGGSTSEFHTWKWSRILSLPMLVTFADRSSWFLFYGPLL
jgi:hypothetical protein